MTRVIRLLVVALLLSVVLSGTVSAAVPAASTGSDAVVSGDGFTLMCTGDMIDLNTPTVVSDTDGVATGPLLFMSCSGRGPDGGMGDYGPCDGPTTNTDEVYCP